MPVRYSEEWIVKVGKEAFVLDEKQFMILKEAMKKNERWVSFEKFIISIPHIECIYLNHREIADKLPEGKKEVVEPISKVKWDEIRKNLYKKIGRRKG